MADRDIWAVIPVKDFNQAKSRLAAILDADERRQLSRVMLRDVLAAASGATRIAGIIVVTNDPEAADLAAAVEARVLNGTANLGPTEAVSAAARLLSAEGHAGMMSIPGDVPLSTPAEIDLVLDTHDIAPAVSLVPDGDGGGSNAIVCSPPEVISLSFGEGSFSAHLDTAKQHGIEARVVRPPGLGLDVDHPEDLMAFLEVRALTLTGKYLEESGIAGRLTTDSSLGKVMRGHG